MPLAVVERRGVMACCQERGGQVDGEFLVIARADYELCKGAPRGLGDTVSSVLGALGIQPCGGCHERAEWLNEKAQYKR